MARIALNGQIGEMARKERLAKMVAMSEINKLPENVRIFGVSKLARKAN